MESRGMQVLLTLGTFPSRGSSVAAASHSTPEILPARDVAVLPDGRGRPR